MHDVAVQPTTTGEGLYLQHRATIERAIAFVCRRNRLVTDDAEEFAAEALLKLVDHDYAVLRKHEGRSSLATYLAVVVQRFFLDYRIRKWGKWRPSARARRHGPLAIRFEQLVSRDGLSIDEACELLTTASGGRLKRHDLEHIAAWLPERRRRHFEGDEALTNVPTADLPPDDAIASTERSERATEVWSALGRALTEFPSEDRLLLTMRYLDGRTVAEIAITLHLDQKRLYRRIDALLETLRERLEAVGIRADDARDLLAHVRERGDDRSPFDIALAEMRAEHPSLEQGANSGAR